MMYYKNFSTELMGWNFLFNFGYVYTDLRSLLIFVYQVMITSTGISTISWTYIGQVFGDLVFRFYFSSIVNKSIYFN